jgi:hypothetical protein
VDDISIEQRRTFAARLRSFDEATERQARRQVDLAPNDRGWTRDDLYDEREFRPSPGMANRSRNE